MNNVIALKMPLVLAVTAAILILHIVCAVISTCVRGRAAKPIGIALAVLNGIAHLLLVGYSILKDIPTDELLCMLMLSAAVGMVSMGISEKKRKAREDV